jgi:subtilase family serine protease
LLSGLTPAEVQSAYGLDSIGFSTPYGTVKGDGAGQVIALIDAYHDPYIAADLHAFDVAYGLPDPQLIVANQAGTKTNAGWALEESLDVEWAHAIAPGATLLVVEAQSQSRQALVTAVNSARSTPGVDAISMSWGFNEFSKERTYNSIFTTPAGHRGITFFGASGDSGPQGGVEWPSASPTVVAVGGTSLDLNFSGAYQFETAWDESSGGYSHFEGEPSYERAVQGTLKRSTPDVAFDGDPGTGVQVYQTSLFTGRGSWEVVGGTSLGTPAWAGIIAIVDQGRNLLGLGSLDGATQTLPALYAAPPRDFNAIAPLAANVGSANTSTGRGTPNGAALIYDLVTSTITVPLTLTGSTKGSSISSVSRKRSRRRAAELFPLHSLPLHVAGHPGARSAVRLGRRPHTR